MVDEQTPLDEYATKAKKLIIDQGYISTGKGNPTLPYPSSSKYVLEYLYGNCKATSIYVPVEMWTQFKARCVEIHKNLSVVISHFIADWLGGRLSIPELEQGHMEKDLDIQPQEARKAKLKMPKSNPTRYPSTCPGTQKGMKPELCRKCPSSWPRAGCIFPDKAQKHEESYLRQHPMEALLQLGEEGPKGEG